ncbi:MAG: YihY/virulence factor BrkB family protein [Gemmatimonadota bacterium]|nr:YihY/virulence factor BrkB family protein [Gemmatimonadota bacterium]
MYEKANDDDVFFMASAIAFNVLIALFPLLILGVGLTGFVLSTRFDDPTAAVIALVADVLPDAGVDLTGLVQGLTEGLVTQRTGFTLVGLVFFVLLATRLVGTVRTALREIFDVADRRGVVQAKLFDVLVVLIGVVLLTLNLGVTVALSTAMDYTVDFIGLEGWTLTLAQRTFGIALALGSIWILFLITYRYLPARSIPWKSAAIAATFTALGYEVLKGAFSWYATEVADYGSAFGNMATVAVLFFWIYYGSLVFILGGEFAQVYTMRKASRVGVVSFPEET